MAKTRTHSRGPAAAAGRAAANPPPHNRAPNIAATLAMLGLLGVTPLAAGHAADDPPVVPPAAPEQAPAPVSAPQEVIPPPVTQFPDPPAWPPSWLSPGAPPPSARPATPPAATPAGGGLLNGTPIDQSKIQQQQFQGNSAERWLGPWARNLYVSGGTSLTSRSFSVDGSEQAQEIYRQQNNSLFFGTRQVGPFQQNMDLTVQGSVFNVFNVNARITNTRQGNYLNQSFGFNYKSKGTELNIGDVNAALPGNEFVTFSRTLRGLTFGRDFGSGMRLQGVASLTQAVTRRGTFLGNGTRGPYPLNASSIIEGSEKIRRNGQDLQRGSDYLVDYLLGQVTFQEGLIITPNDTIEYTYEAQNFNSTPGLLGGLRWEMPLGQGNQVGITWLQQQPTSGNNGVQEIVERFPVYEDQSYSYPLASLIEVGTPVRVFYLEQELVENIDYTLNRDLRFFRMLRRFPPDTAFNGTLSLSVRYRPVRQSSVGTKRSVLGFDSISKLTKNIDLNVQVGQSTGQESQSGTATSVTTSFRSKLAGREGGLSGSVNWRDIGAGYSSIDSIAGAFLRAEKGLRGSLNLAPTSFLQINASLNQTRLANGYGSTQVGLPTTTPTDLVWNDNRNYNVGFSLTLPNLPKLDFTRTETTQRALIENGTTSKFSSEQLNLNWQKGIYGLSASVGRTASKGRSVFSYGYSNNVNSGLPSSGGLLDNFNNATNYSTDSSSNNTRFRLSVNPASWISIVGAIGFSKTKYGSTSLTDPTGSQTDARDSSLGVSLPLSDRLAFTLNYVESTNGRTATGITGGGNSQIDNSISGQQTRTYGLNAHYIPFDSLDLNFDLSRSLQLIPGYDNTNNNTYQVTASYTPDSRISLLGNYVNQDVRYIGSQQGNSGNKSYSLTATAGPFGKLTYTATYQYMNTGSLLYNNNSNGVIPGIGDTNGTIGLNSVARSRAAAAALRTRQSVLPTGGNNYLSQNQNLTIWNLRADYPIGANRSVFLQWQTLDSRSPGSGGDGSTDYYTASNYRRGAGTMGLEFRLSELLNLTFDLNLINMADRERDDYSYRARAFNMDLSARF